MNHLNRTTLHLAVGILTGLLLPALPLQGQQFEWAKQFGGLEFSTGNSVAVDAGGNVYTTGTFSGTVDFDTGAEVFNLTAPNGNSNAFVTKLDSVGNLVWARQFRGFEFSGGSSVAVDASGNVYTMGTFATPSTSILVLDRSI